MSIKRSKVSLDLGAICTELHRRMSSIADLFEPNLNLSIRNTLLSFLVPFLGKKPTWHPRNSVKPVGWTMIKWS